LEQKYKLKPCSHVFAASYYFSISDIARFPARKKPIWNFNAAPRYLRRMWMIILPVIVILWALTMAALARHRRRR
jgi:hypothetical protein